MQKVQPSGGSPLRQNVQQAWPIGIEFSKAVMQLQFYPGKQELERLNAACHMRSLTPALSALPSNSDLTNENSQMIKNNCALKLAFKLDDRTLKEWIKPTICWMIFSATPPMLSRVDPDR
jgi:hypothetical protein